MSRRTLVVAVAALVVLAASLAPGAQAAPAGPSWSGARNLAPSQPIKFPRSTEGTEQLYRGDLVAEIGLGCSNPSGTSGGPNDWAVGVTASATPPFDIVSTTYNIFTNVSPTINQFDFRAWAGGASPGAQFGSQAGLPFGTGNHTAVIAPAITVSAANAPGGQFYFGFNQGQTTAGIRIGEDTSSASAGTSFIRAPTCGAASFVTVDSIGYGGNWVMAAVIDFGPPPELLVLDDSTILGQPGAADSCSTDPANDNGIMEPGEYVTIPIQLTAQGISFSGISGSLVSNTAGVSVIDGVQSWPSIAAGNSAVSNAPFSIFIDEATACSTSISLTLTVTANEGGPFVYPMSGQIGAPLSAPVPLPLVVPDNNPTGAQSTLNVASSLVVSDVNVVFQMTHTWVGDLIVTITPPGGGPITLMDRPGVPPSTVGCSDNNIDVVFDDDGGVDPETHCSGTTPWLSGQALAPGLGALAGSNAQGNWVLTVSDNAGGDTGQVTNWSLETTPPLSGICNVCVGGQPPAGGGGPTVLEIPALSKVGLALLAVVLAGAAALVLRRRG